MVLRVTMRQTGFVAVEGLEHRATGSACWTSFKIKNQRIRILTWKQVKQMDEGVDVKRGSSE